jgi:hypothetical protein
MLNRVVCWPKLRYYNLFATLALVNDQSLFESLSSYGMDFDNVGYC